MNVRGGLRAVVHRAVLPAGLTHREHRFLRLHLLSSLFSGVVYGAMNLADVTLAKTLAGGAFQLTVFNVLIGVSYLGSLFFVGMMRGRPKALFILLFAAAGRLGFWLLPLSSRPGWFTFVLGLAWFCHALILVAQVSIVQRAYPAEHRNTLFGISISIMTAMNLATSVALGWLLEWNEQAYAIYYGIAGTAGFAGAVLLARLDRLIDRPAAGEAPSEGKPEIPARADAGSPLYRPMGQPGVGAAMRSMRASVALVARILRDDGRYRRFQVHFFLYGIAFLSMTPVVPLFLVHDLQLDYGQIGLAKGLMGQAGQILFPPLLGRMMHGQGPVRFSGRMFALLSLHTLLLVAAGLVPPGARIPVTYVAFALFGVSMAGVNLAWHMSSLHFSGRDDPSAYQAVHTVLTGVRGSFAPLIGYAFMAGGSRLAAFAFSTLLLLIAALGMGRMAGAEDRARAAEERRPSPSEY